MGIAVAVEGLGQRVAQNRAENCHQNADPYIPVITAAEAAGKVIW